jgi:hypothetical protein
MPGLSGIRRIYCGITATRLCVHPILKFIFSIANERTKLSIPRSAALQSPSAQSRQTDLHFARDFEFGQKYLAHVGTLAAMGFAAPCESTTNPNMNRNAGDVEYDFCETLCALRIHTTGATALSADRINARRIDIRHAPCLALSSP